MDSEDKLNNAKSPYLRQHASDPVNWHPWDSKALEFAKEHDKPILLSIGYASCHWCHVMQEESYCNEEVAIAMNRLFVNILVDKEERPDLDKIYQTAYQLLMGNIGGWPLTLFLSPHTLIPYFGGTYFHSDGQGETPGFHKLLNGLNDVFYHEKEKIAQQEQQTMSVLQLITQPRVANDTPLAKDLCAQAVQSLQEDFDTENGGFGTDSKFPCCPALDFLLNSSEPLVQHMAIFTLEVMANSALHDKDQGGFYRYTVDAKWQKPHTEKMLYDNVQLLAIYAKAFTITKNELFKQVSISIGQWMIKKLRDPDTGIFFAAVDADSPSVDSNLIPSWNGLAIRSFNQAGKLLDQPDFIKVAEDLAKYLPDNINYQFLDDYAGVLTGLLDLDPKNPICKKIADQIIDKFYDPDNAGFYFTPNDQEIVLYRPKMYADEATPSGNGLACLALLQLGNKDIVKDTLESVQSYLNEAPELHLNLLQAYDLLHEI